MSVRPQNPVDRLICGADRMLRTLYGVPRGTGRPSPARGVTDPPSLDPRARTRAARLMRVNLAGEVAAQALYHGQGVGARNPSIAARLARAAQEENDHLLWCRQRLAELDAGPSLLNPLWYAGSFAIGAAAGLRGDAHSLGFLDETEAQVAAHLGRHLRRLPPEDSASRALLVRMREDELRHGLGARAAGGRRPPPAIRLAMRLVSRVMTVSAYWI